MIRNANRVETDIHQQELTEQGKYLFNLVANKGDIHKFITGNIPPHWHNEQEIFCLMEGSVRIGIGDTFYDLHAGEGCFINTGILHSFTGLVPSPCLYRSFVFDPSIISGAPGSVFDIHYIRPLMENGAAFIKISPNSDPGSADKHFFRAFDQAFSACTSESPGYEFQVRNALSEIFLVILEKNRSLSVPKFPEIQELRLKQMLEWIDQNLEKNISVKNISAVASICVRECQRIFHRYLNCTPIEYVRQRRLLLAARQLSLTDLPVTDIAINCGFTSPSYFTRQFRLLTGITPTKYRADSQKNHLPGIETSI